MKKIFLTLFLLFTLIGFVQIKAYCVYDTGYNEYSEINFEQKGARLLINIFDYEKNDTLKKIKIKFMGWNYRTIYSKQRATYIGKTIFSRYNNTNSPIDFNYSSTILNTSESSIKTIGSLSGGGSAKSKVMSGNLEGMIRREIGSVKTQKITESTDFKVKIHPGKKVSLIIKGDLRVSNGGAKYFVFGICTKKGTWEIIDILSEYYELYEETIKK